MNSVTKIRDLIAALQECDPDGTITISLDGALIFHDDEPGEVEYSFEPMIDFLCSKPDAERSDRVYFCLSKADTERIVAGRPYQNEGGSETTLPPTNPAIVTDAPVAIALALSQETYGNLLAVVASCNLVEANNKGATTHGKLDVPGLLAMLAEDAAMTNTRPGSWEGANMQQVLDSHGY